MSDVEMAIGGMSIDALPSGWAVSPLSDLSSNRSGNSKMIKGKLSSEPTKGFPYPGFSASGPDVWLNSYEHEGRAIIISAVGARCGKAFEADGKWTAIANTHIVRPNESVLDAKLFWYLINDEKFWVRGGSAQPFVKVSKTFERLFPLPPLAEQKRIADKLEAVLGRVDACRARLDRVPSILKRFRQSVLAAATSGKLTEEWRESNQCGEDAASLLERMARERRAVHAEQASSRKYREAEPVVSEELPEIPVSWRWTNFDHCSSEVSVGHVGPMKDRYVDEGIAFLRCQNVRPLRFNSRGLVRIPMGFHKELSKSELCGGEILVVRSGANTGDCCVFPCGFEEANCSDLVIARPLSGLSSEYGAIYVNSPIGQSLLDKKQAGVAQPHFNIGAMRVKAFPLAPFAEQQEIVQRVEALFAFADRIESRLATAQKTVERLSPSILAKAFRGELVPQDPNDEPASALLERLRQSAPAVLKVRIGRTSKSK